jgi:hypothetical protein
MLKKALIIWLFVCFAACQEKDTPILLQSEKLIAGFSSGSGMTFFENRIYAVGDDDPYLWILDTKGNLVDTILIVDSPYLVDGRIKKSKKPDLEAMAIIRAPDGEKLLLFPSGSDLAKRVTAYVFDPKSREIQALNVLPLFQVMLQMLDKEQTINIEGLASDQEHLFFFNRDNNSVFRMKQSNFTNYFLQQNNEPLNLELFAYNLPELKGQTATFSSAEKIPNTEFLIFSASTEATENWIDDGEIGPSFIGLLNLRNMEISFCHPVTTPEGSLYIGKIEGIIGHYDENGKLSITAITDNDDGITLFLQLSTRVKLY